VEDGSGLGFGSDFEEQDVEHMGVHPFSELLSLTIPPFVETLPEHCFAGRKRLSVVKFESGSRLARIEQFALSNCSLLSSICVPS
jgi:hypothetical protein